jgi:hypothetical protein
LFTEYPIKIAGEPARFEARLARTEHNAELVVLERFKIEYLEDIMEFVLELSAKQ